ncbi:MAG: hypothetical protein IJV31_12630 [Clostridia bacterium]|nr:hypothetical protein [Clostridia bacterium]
MAKEIEIEKKYKVKRLPENLEKYEHKTIEQSYLNKGGSSIRLRKFIKENEIRCVFSKKVRVEKGSIEYRENNIELPENIYQDLLEAKEGRTILKTRYIIPLEDGLKVELDMFHDFFEGVCVAEIEFNSIEQANNYKIPDWLGEELTGENKMTNAYMATKAEDISEYKEYMI